MTVRSLPSHRWWIIALILLSGNWTGNAVAAQDWYVVGQRYAKIKVANDGLYRITYNDLAGIFPNLASINPQNFQMYWRGRPYPILVEDGGDNSFDPGDFILFVGVRQDGTLDRPLYRQPSDQPNPRISLYTDTNVYFLTAGSGPGSRINVVGGGHVSGRPTASSFWYDARTEFFQRYYDDINSQDKYFGISYYGTGEGWMSVEVINGKQITSSILLPNRLYPDPQVRLRAYAVSQSYDLICGRQLNNNFLIEIRTTYEPVPGTFRDTTYVQIDTFFNGYKAIRIDTPVAPYYVRDTVTLRFRVRPRDQSGWCYSAVALAYLELSYLHTLSISDLSLPFQFQTLSDIAAPYANYTFQQLPAQVQHPWIYDTATHTLYRGVLAGTSLQTSLPAGRNLFFFDSAEVTTPPSITSHTFSNLLSIPPQTDYLIVSHTSLKAGAEAYKNYRQSTGFTPHIVYADSLYDAFYYGVHHPMALHRFFQRLHQAHPSLPLEYVLFLGKGIQTSSILRGANAAKDLVPTWGIPPSDYLFVNTVKDSSFIPDYYIGRVSALDNADVFSYLGKVQTYEQTGTERWRKNILHLGGGRYANENALYAGFLNEYAAIAEDTPAGMFTSLLRKSDDLPVTTTLKDKIIEKVNDGITLLTYFGHGAADILEVDIGEPQEYHNTGKYPFMYFAGCILGNCYTDGSMGERFLFYDSAGALVWLAGTNYGFQTELHQFNLSFYTNCFRKHYGESIGKILHEAMTLYAAGTIDIWKEMQCLQFNLQGDPAIRFYSIPRPDYEITPANVSYSPMPIHTQVDSLTLSVTAFNWGRAIQDSVVLQVIHTYPGNYRTDTFTYRVLPPFSRRTYELRLPLGGAKAHGRNLFAVTIDPANEVEELDEQNNGASIEVFVASNTAVPVFPVEYTLVGTPTVTLKAQGTGKELETFEFEIDTAPDFTSPWKQSSGPVTSSYLATWEVTLLPADSLDYYWRVWLIGQDSLTQAWGSASFTYVHNTYPGWGQVDYPQYSTATPEGVYFDSTRQLRFYREVSPIIKVQSTGELHPDPAAAEIRYDYARMIFGYLNQHIYFVAFNPDNLELFSYPTQYASNTRIPAGQKTFFHFHFGSNIGNNSVRDSFAHIIRQIPDGYHVILFAGRAANNFPQWRNDSVFNYAMQLIGASQYRQITGTGWPYICIGRKGNYGPATELTADTSSNALDPRIQLISASTTFYPLRKRGQLFSRMVGPARRWKDFFSEWHRTGSDSVQFRLWGVTPTQEKVLLTDYFRSTYYDLDTLSATQYPYLQIEAYIEDLEDRTPPQLRYWIVHYEGRGDLSVRPDLFYRFYADTLIRGDTLSLGLSYENISSDSFPDSVVVVRTIRRMSDYAVLFSDTVRQRPLPPFHRDSVFFRYSTAALKEGPYLLSIRLNPDSTSLEAHAFNNFYNQPFFVKDDHLNPIIDVTFDGKHIFNGEEVSPSPEIRISGRDDHPFFYIDDTALVTIAVRYPADSTARRLSYADPAVEFIPAEGQRQPAIIYWRPPHLADGIYTLEVTIRDKTGNVADSPSYAIDFEVVNATTISYVLPYPNPFTTATRFVYSLTGEKLPDRLTIYIMSITGEVVKEIPLHEYDAFQVGQNISSYTWDGTTDDGRPLANGVYLYKVVAYVDGEPVKIRSKGLDPFFKHGIGKMVILR